MATGDFYRNHTQEFDLSSGKKYTGEDFRKRAEFPDEWLITAEKRKLLDVAAKQRKKVRILLSDGKEDIGYLMETGLANTFILKDPNSEEHKKTGGTDIKDEDIEEVEILQ